MAKIHFDIKYKPQIESGEYKIETEDGFPATILDWSFRKDSGSPYICVKITKNGEDYAFLYSEDGKRFAHERLKDNDLIIITPESEDERIRLDIVALIKFDLEDGSAVSPGARTTKEEALCYLEKQKEKKESATTEWPNISNCLKDCKNCKAKCFYRKEEYEENKPTEWSEEDEANWQNYIKQLELQYSKGPNVVLWDDINWLKYVHDKFKSLHLQPYWKPSEEQMNALADAIKRDVFPKGNREYLESLYNDLKKLM